MVTKGYGFSIHDIDWSCPADLEPYSKAYELECKVRDEEMWRMGIYVQSGTSVAIEHNLAGKKAKSEYIKRPLLQEIDRKTSEEELQRQRELFVARFEAMGANFRLMQAQKQKEGESGIKNQ